MPREDGSAFLAERKARRISVVRDPHACRPTKSTGVTSRVALSLDVTVGRSPSNHASVAEMSESASMFVVMYVMELVVVPRACFCVCICELGDSVSVLAPPRCSRIRRAARDASLREAPCF